MKHDYPIRENEMERLGALRRPRVADAGRQANPGMGGTTSTSSPGACPRWARAHFPGIHGPKGA
ncbi:MAG TPA: hypothetical protein VGG34_09340 [Opitutaceae bacterium]|jgi:hypothetical protein